jgi:hypothetical protein
MQTAHDRGAQSGMDGAVTVNPRHRGQGWCRNRDAPVAFARAIIARVTGVAVAFVLDHEFDRRESRLECITNLLFKSHYFSLPPSIPARMA